MTTPDQRERQCRWLAVRRWPNGDASWTEHRTWLGAWRAKRRRRSLFDGLDDRFERSSMTVERNR